MIQYVQQTTNAFYTGSASSSLLVAVNNLPAIGNVLIGVVKKSTVGSTLNSITDPRGNSWNINVAAVASSIGTGTYIVSCVVNTAYQSGDLLQLNFSTAINNDGMICAEFNGMPPISYDSGLYWSYVDVAGNPVTNNYTGAFSSSTINPFDLVVTGITLAGGIGQTITPPSGMTQLSTTGGSSAQQMSMAFLIANTTSTFSSEWQWPTSAVCAAAGIAFLPSQSSGDMFLQM